ncbi:hypothetical protein DHEL01_v211413 [Diaporthe helianthi]|uniref:Uncharacterized protein n=1 Tax=Diaporthe helianthi TaxID=158607 RepID=A0A2P5HIV8_DIAHE|nr:hypothetical protein DHEL01_v211413 [Diaporthe helianthi]
MRVWLLNELVLDAAELVSRQISDMMLERSEPVAVASSDVSLLSSELTWDSMEEMLNDLDVNMLLVWIVDNPDCPTVVVGLPNVYDGWVSPGIPPSPTVSVTVTVTVTVQWPF